MFWTELVTERHILRITALIWFKNIFKVLKDVQEKALIQLIFKLFCVQMSSMLVLASPITPPAFWKYRDDVCVKINKKLKLNINISNNELRNEFLVKKVVFFNLSDVSLLSTPV